MRAKFINCVQDHKDHCKQKTHIIVGIIPNCQEAQKYIREWCFKSRKPSKPYLAYAQLANRIGLSDYRRIPKPANVVDMTFNVWCFRNKTNHLRCYRDSHESIEGIPIPPSTQASGSQASPVFVAIIMKIVIFPCTIKPGISQAVLWQIIHSSIG